MGDRNGLKKWLLLLVTTVALSFFGWLAVTVVSHSSSIASQQSKQESIEKWLERIDMKLDQALRR